MITATYPDPTAAGVTMPSAYLWLTDFSVDQAGNIAGNLAVNRSAADVAAGEAPLVTIPIRSGELVGSAIAAPPGFVCPNLFTVLGSATPVTLAADPLPSQLWSAALGLLYAALAPAFPGCVVAP